MKIYNMIRDEKLQYDINRKQQKYHHYHQVKWNEYKNEYLTGEKILLSNQSQIIEQAKFTCFPLGKDLEKQLKTI